MDIDELDELLDEHYGVHLSCACIISMYHVHVEGMMDIDQRLDRHYGVPCPLCCFASPLFASAPASPSPLLALGTWPLTS